MTPVNGHTPAPGPVAQLMIRAVRFYQRRLSPRKPAPTCRFSPTCSAYAVTAIQRHGALKGGWLALWRFFRCNPLFPGGYDPVPDTGAETGNQGRGADTPPRS